MTGALSLIDQHGNLITTADITSTDGRVDAQDLRANLTSMMDIYGIDMAVVENVASMPKQGVSTTFKFGRAAGYLESAVQMLQIPMALVPPSQWKAKLHMSGKDKDFPRVWCQRRWPTVDVFNAKGKGQARADAVCIALAWLEMHPEWREGTPVPPSKRPPPRHRIVP